MLECIGICLDMLLQVYVTVSRYVFGYVVTGLLQCLGMCLDMLLQVYVKVSKYVFVCCYRSMLVSRYVFVYVVTGLC